MEEKFKKCSRCGKELHPTGEFFYRDSKTKDGFQPACKKCVKAKIKESPSYKSSLKNKGTSGNGAKAKAVKRSGNQGPQPLTTASPEEIIGALRKGVALEICQMILERFR